MAVINVAQSRAIVVGLSESGGWSDIARPRPSRLASNYGNDPKPGGWLVTAEADLEGMR